MYQRIIEQKLQDYLSSEEKKIFFLWGPRRSGKTTLIKKIATQLGTRYFNFDILQDREFFVSDKNILASLVKDFPIILIDEVQTFPEATAALKVLFDEFKVKIVATGSSELRRKGVKEFDTLAGRYIEKFCLPLSLSEINNNSDQVTSNTESFKKELVHKITSFGTYPEIFSLTDDNARIANLENLVDSYVIKDIIDIYNLKDLELAKKILIMVALQIGNEVSYNEIARNLQANVGTISNYIEVFKKNYVLIELPAFKTNLRRAVSENRKLYFYDLGVRNSLLRDFRPLDLRVDKGAIFENFIISEIEKMRLNSDLNFNKYFYREIQGSEVDLIIEDFYKRYFALEIKVSPQKVKSVFPLAHELLQVNLNNYVQILADIELKIKKLTGT